MAENETTLCAPTERAPALLLAPQSSFSMPALSHHHLAAPGVAPGDLALIPDFVEDQAEAAALLEAVLGGRQGGGGGPQTTPAPAPSGPGWKLAAGRHVRSVGGTVLGSVLLPSPLPSWAAGLMRRLGEAGVGFGDGGGGAPSATANRANHVLANVYPAGAGILPHTDGPAYAPVAAILSLGEDSPAVMRFFTAGAGDGDGGGGGGAGGAPPAPAPAPAFSIFLPPRSLLVFRGAAYTAHRHGIAADVGGDVVDGSLLNPAAAAAWAAAAGAGREQQQQQQQEEEAQGQAPLTIRRGPLRVSLTVRRVLKVRTGVLRL